MTEIKFYLFHCKTLRQKITKTEFSFLSSGKVCWECTLRQGTSRTRTLASSTTILVKAGTLTITVALTITVTINHQRHHHCCHHHQGCPHHHHHQHHHHQPSPTFADLVQHRHTIRWQDATLGFVCAAIILALRVRFVITTKSTSIKTNYNKKRLFQYIVHIMCRPHFRL